MIVRIRWDEVIQLALERLNAFNRFQVGSNLYIQSLMCLARTQHPAAIGYLQEIMQSTKPLLPWRRKALKLALAKAFKEFPV